MAITNRSRSVCPRVGKCSVKNFEVGVDIYKLDQFFHQDSVTYTEVINYLRCWGKLYDTCTRLNVHIAWMEEL